ncbi:hypothetical protein [Flavobacterium sp.]|uniref:hypothetical protein n=1 Tax=Flavobacterium sp. TaxID=239 RepID=UPI00260E308C|nr:hypothetical protein [Flavobacterium sp.]
MKPDKAVEILRQQIEKLQTSKDNRTQSWTIETRTYIVYFFGENSFQNEYFRHLSWSIEPKRDHDRQEKDAIKFLEDCINTIKNVGLYKKPTTNILSKLSDSLIVLILTAIATVAVGIGKYISDIQNIELKRENIELKEKIKKTINQSNKRMNIH